MKKVYRREAVFLRRFNGGKLYFEEGLSEGSCNLKRVYRRESLFECGLSEGSCILKKVYRREAVV